MAQPWPGKASAVAGNFYKLPDGRVRFYAGGDEFRLYGVDSQGNERIAVDPLLDSLSNLLPKGASQRSYGGGAMHDFGGLPDKAPQQSGLTDEQMKSLIEGTEGAAARVARIKAESDALVDAARKDPNHQYHTLFQKAPVVLADDVDARDSEYRRMAQQYAPGADLWATDAGKKMIERAQSNQYKGDAAGLPEYYANQRKVGTGAMPEIIDAMGYTGAMAEWAKANPALAMREYNKQFGNSYAGTGPSNEEIKAAMDAGNFFAAEGSPNPLGKTGAAREANTAQTAQAQNVAQQQELNLQEIQNYMDSAVPGLRGKKLIGDQFTKILLGGY